MSYSFVRRAAIAAATLPLLLGGCTDDDPVPQIPDPTTPSPTASETSTEPVEPTLPPEAQGKGAKAAEAFVRHYYAMVNYAQATGDTKGLKPLALASCAACSGGLDFIEDIYARGGTNEGGEYTVVSSKTTGRRIEGPNPSYYLTVVTENTRQTISGAGDLDAVYEAGKSTLQFQVVGNPEGWQVASWGAKT